MNKVLEHLNGVIEIELTVFRDERGYFVELFQAERYRELGIDEPFVQDNFSRSSQNTVRGLHCQNPLPQGKLVWAIRGCIYDVIVDLRRSSPTFGQWKGIYLDDDTSRQVYVPPGFAHGFCVLSPVADVIYKCTEYYAPEYEQTILWNDPHLDIRWPLKGRPHLSQKDQNGQPFADCLTFA